MDIPLPAKAQHLLASVQRHDKPDLQLGQQITAVIQTSNPKNNSLELQIAGKTWTAQLGSKNTNNVPASVTQLSQLSNQSLRLLVIRLAPTPLLQIKELLPGNTTIQNNSQTHIKGLFLELMQPKAVNTVNKTETDVLQNFQRGQKIPVKVVHVSAQQIQFEVLQPAASEQNKNLSTRESVVDNSALLGKRLVLPTQAEAVAVKTGQSVMLEVLKPGMPPTFKISALKTSEPLAESIVQSAMKQFLPKQQPLTVILNRMITETPKWEQDSSIPQTLKQLAQQILQNLPPSSRMHNAQEIKSQINDSGVFLEAKLAHASAQETKNAPPQQFAKDIKNNLLKIMQTIAQQISIPETNNVKAEQRGLLELFSKAESSLAGIVVEQFLSLPKDENGKQIWHVEIPFLNQDQADSVKLSIERQPNPTQTDKNQWCVKLTLTPPQLGTIHCTINYADNNISTYFSSETSKTQALLQHHLDVLRQNFSAAGLATGSLQVQRAEPMTSAEKLGITMSLLDEKI